MSQMRVNSLAGGQMWWKITDFTSPLTGTLSSAQLRNLESHYPIKASQQMLELEIQTRSIDEMHAIQTFVRRTQLGALGGASPLMKMWWPQRNIDNWTGIPLGIQGGGERFIQAAKVNVRIQLVDSLISERTYTSSSGTPFDDIIGTVIPPLKPDDTTGMHLPTGPSGNPVDERPKPVPTTPAPSNPVTQLPPS